MAATPFSGGPSAEEARSVALCLEKAKSVRSFLPMLVWLGIVCLIFGVRRFDLMTGHGFGWLIVGATLIVMGGVQRWSSRRSAIRAVLGGEALWLGIGGGNSA